MQPVGIGLIVIGSLVAVVGDIWLIVVAFQKGGILWGIGSLLTGIIGLIFAITHWADARRPFFTYLAGVVVLLIGYGLLLAGAGSTTT